MEGIAMAGRRIKSSKVKESEYPYSKAIAAGNFIFVSGCVPRWPDGRVITDDVEAGIRACLKDIKNLVEAGGMTLSDLVKVNVHLRDIGDFDAMNAVYRTYFPVDPPARATQQAKIGSNSIMEVEAIAYKE
jgi:2-iminobutanoate/2-iminopropanoate deaminase